MQFLKNDESEDAFIIHHPDSGFNGGMFAVFAFLYEWGKRKKPAV